MDHTLNIPRLVAEQNKLSQKERSTKGHTRKKTTKWSEKIKTKNQRPTSLPAWKGILGFVR